MNKKLNLGGKKPTGLSNMFKAQIIERRPDHPDYGKVVFETDFAPNLILENGMNKLPTTQIANLFLYCAIGSDTTPTQDSSGSITATIAAGVVTANTAFFSGGDVGKLFRLASGEKSTIASFTDSTHVTLTNTSLNQSTPATFVNYRIAQTGLFAEIKRTNNYLTGTGNCGSTLSSNVYTHQRTYDFPIETGTVTYNEVGFSDQSSSGANLNTRGIFASAPITVVSGQQLRVIYLFVVTFTPIAPRTKVASVSGWPSLQHPVTADSTTSRITLVANGFTSNTQVQFIGTTPPGGISFGTPYYVIPVTADTFQVSASSGPGSPVTITSNGSGVILLTNTNGQEQLLLAAFSSVNTSGGTQANNFNINEPSGGQALGMVPFSGPIPSFGTSSSSASGSTGCCKLLVADTYVTGSYTLTKRVTYATTECNDSTIRSAIIGGQSNSSTVTMTGEIFLFDQEQEKTNLNTLTIVWRWTWDRDFS